MRGKRETIRLEEVDRFKAADENENEHTIICLQKVSEIKTSDNTISTSRGTKKFFTSDGDPVDAIDSETFQILKTDQIIKKTS